MGNLDRYSRAEHQRWERMEQARTLVGVSDPSGAAGVEGEQTLAVSEWAKARGYDPETRTYRR